MENIFTFNPTAKELVELTGSENTQEKDYLKKRIGDFIILDLALLCELRNEFEKAENYWQQIKELKTQYDLGFDDQIIPL
jgi:hypothetical protein